MELPDPVELFGSIDVYVFDQLLRGRIRPGLRVLDVGCGGGRNLRYLLRAGYDVAGCDPDPEAIASVRRLAAELAPPSSRGLEDRFRVERAEELSFAEHAFDVVLCNAVLHFARDGDHFRAMLAGAWRPLRPGGVFFARLASSIGIEDRVVPLGDGRHRLPDGSQRFLVDEPALLEAGRRLGGELLDPIKTTSVQGQRCMTTWVLRRTATAGA
jgi:SAM-dependent methyltransferase